MSVSVEPASPGIDPHLTCAFALHSSPGAYGLLLGAGVSVSSGVPSAWDVQEELIRRVARIEGNDPGDPSAWYHQRFGRAATYDDLLEALTHTQAERQALLRGFFEPTAEEREQGLKQPTPAHRAVARLAAAGLVRVILTINFDRLTETALRDEGVEPTVVASPADIQGLNPLHAQRCLVVHLHGDYLNPSGMLNTAEELGTYPEDVDMLLDKILSEYGLVIAGWSATWDTALRAAVTRNPNRFYATYWVDPFPLSDVAQDLKVLRRAVYVQATADRFIGQVADACASLAETGQRHPLTVPVAVATAKRALVGGRTAIPLHDAIREEMERLRRLDVLQTMDFNTGAWEKQHEARLGRIWAALEVPSALVATAVYWGNPGTDGWWFDDIERFAKRPLASGVTALIYLLQVPAIALLYAAGTAAAAAHRYDLIVRLLTEPTTTDNAGEDVLVSVALDPEQVLTFRRGHRWMYRRLQSLLDEHLGLGAAAYCDAWEQFEYLRLVHATSVDLKRRGEHVEAAQFVMKVQQLEQAVAEASGSPAVRDQKKAELAELLTASESPRKTRAGHVLMRRPHIRALGYSHNYMPAPATRLFAEIERESAGHPLLEAGLCDGNPHQMLAAMMAVNDAFNAYANEAAWSTSTGTSGFLPSGVFYPDEIGPWATAKDE